MAISERVLKRWRKEALLLNEACNDYTQEDALAITVKETRVLAEVILLLTQDLIDKILLEKEKAGTI